MLGFEAVWFYVFAVILMFKQWDAWEKNQPVPGYVTTLTITILVVGTVLAVADRFGPRRD